MTKDNKFTDDAGDTFFSLSDLMAVKKEYAKQGVELVFGTPASLMDPSQTECVEVRRRSAPVSKVEDGPLTLAIKLDPDTAAWACHMALTNGMTPEEVVEGSAAAIARMAHEASK